MVDITQNMDVFVEVSGILKTLAINLKKISGDFRLLSSGPRGDLAEIKLPEVQTGSLIMPGKVNPVMSEMITQISLEVISRDKAITLAAGEGQLELNAFIPLISFKLLTQLKIFKNGINKFTDKCVSNIKARPERCRELLEDTPGLITVLAPHIGYDICSKLVKRSLKENKPLKKLIIEEGYLSKKELNEILKPENMT